VTRADIVVSVFFGLWLFLLSLVVIGGLVALTILNIAAHL